MDGRSIVPWIRSPDAAGRDAWLLEFWRYYPENTPSYVGVRTERYKYVEFARGRDPWLFDLVQDPGEGDNLHGTPAGERLVPPLRERLRRLSA